MLRKMRGEEESHSLSSSSYPSSVPTFSHLSLTILRFISASISIGFAIILFVTIETDGSPFYWSLLEAKWMKTTLVDFYCVLAPLCALAAWRERNNPLISIATVLYFCCLGTTAVHSYLWLVFYRLKPGDPIAKLLA
jgi:hypothetical protein